MLSAQETVALAAGWLEDCPIVVFDYRDLHNINEFKLETVSNAREEPHFNGYFKRIPGTNAFESQHICKNIRAITLGVKGPEQTTFEYVLGEQQLMLHLTDGAVALYKQPRWGRINRDRSDSWMVCNRTFYEDRTLRRQRHDRDLILETDPPYPKTPVYPLHLRITRARVADESGVDLRIKRNAQRAVVAKVAGTATASIAGGAYLGIYGCMAPIAVAFAGPGIVLLLLPNAAAACIGITCMVAGGLAGAIPGAALGWDATSRAVHRPDWTRFSDFDARRLGGVLDRPPYSILIQHRLRHPRTWGYSSDIPDGASQQTVGCCGGIF